jgi:hypothetical protein
VFDDSGLIAASSIVAAWIASRISNRCWTVWLSA